jgi:medium-chain acyl-[acyl-carrier-protein] hydrolase
MTDGEPTVTLLRLGPRRAPARLRLFCFPFAGGGVSTYAQWWRTVPPDVEVLGIQLPGRELRTNEPSMRDCSNIIAACFAAIVDQLTLPYALFGHSMGGLIAFEVAAAIEATAECPAPGHLFISARGVPAITAQPNWHHLRSDAHFLAGLADQFGGVTSEVLAQPELVELLLPALRADVEAVERYVPVPGRRVRCPVTIFGGQSDQWPSVDALAAWQGWCEQPITVSVFDGGHFFINSAREAVTRQIVERWAGAQTAAPNTHSTPGPNPSPFAPPPAT